MKKITLSAVAALVLAGCGGGGGGGHSDSYNKGYQWATTTNDMGVGAYAGFHGIDSTCHYYATQQALGLNPQEWIQGCKDGLTKVISTTSSKPTVDHADAEKFITDQVAQQTGDTLTDVSCPSGVEAKVGVQFDCHFTDAGGSYTVHMKIQKIEDQGITYEYKIDRR